jgi:hypothetical protein
MKEDTRSQTQNNSYFLFLSWIAEEMNAQDIGLANLVVKIQPKATKENLHLIFKAILQKMYNKTSTTRMSRKEMSGCLDVYMNALAIIGLNIEFPDASKKSLLEIYK